MPRLQFLWVIHTTSNEQNANTNEIFRVIIRDPFNQRETVLPFPSLPHNERERGRTDEYLFNLEEQGFIEMEALNADDIGMEILGGNAWLPRSIWVIGQDIQGGRRLLVAQPTWPPENWFSTETSDVGGLAQPKRFLG